jgi:MYXO-CTERM domain-containing protein
MNALNVNWSSGTATSTATAVSASFDVVAVTSDVRDPVGTHTVSQITGTNYRIGGLVNNVTYTVTVEAFSPGGNPSGPSGSVTAMPQQVADFYDTFLAYGGQPQGGCSTGSAGMLGFGALAAVAIARRLRRRK